MHVTRIWSAAHHHNLTVDTPSLDQLETLLPSLLQTYDPVLAWANRHFGVKFAPNNSIFGADQHPDIHAAVAQYLNGELTPFLWIYYKA